MPIEEYSIRVAEAWKVGHKGLDNGVILTVAPNERRTRIEVGYGLEGVIPDAIASRIINGFLLPEFRADRYEQGIVAGVNQILIAARGEEVRIPAGARRSRGPRSSGSSRTPLLWLFIFLMFGFRGFFFLPFLGGRRGYRGGGGFGGGFGGGGGGFGGGGASGGW